jgi:crossover junction endodeoxyribonuclease RuvC
MIILAIDPGFDKLGYAFFEFKSFPSKTHRLLSSGLIKSNSRDKIEVRLYFIYKNLSSLIEKFHPKLIVMEQIFFLKNKKTVVQVSQAQGVILLLSAKYKIETKFITPLQIKQAITGYGRSDKKAIQKMLTLTDKIPAIKEDDEADAVACGLAYCYLN